ncbi:RNA 2',3'-cyclic phosphodiesterase [Methylomonas sp. UP202]|uniref:RNA 2',3'-cyclic phosphodiesterase n=1 Tax=Methylomonas sp. UP202 TaxID=3040943 RepID=UPI00143B3467|nr:RNA 2',3'-cyclic phosphodiesterase [Methylomonas sp. UP202]NJA06559.1 RNA 2',3'-cyclic phosphodiesterase [Methylococcaceae bacterium WWC4]WGS86561.1 RNA 2',3'-cyclic phosphodiesterase [Methylomonas sp. UP202]
MKRLFFALWPPLDALAKLQQLIQHLDRSITPLAISNLHVTLVFLGTVNPKQERELRRRANTIKFHGAELTFDRLDFWQKPSILCLTSTDGLTAVSELSEQLTRISKGLDIPIDNRPFTPHITLCRKIKRPLDTEFEPITWRATGFCLAESVSNSGRRQYRVLEEWPSLS